MKHVVFSSIDCCVVNRGHNWQPDSSAPDKPVPGQGMFVVVGLGGWTNMGCGALF